MASTFPVVSRAAGLAGALLLATVPFPAGAQGLALDTSLLTGGLVRPLGIVDPGDGSGRLFLVQQTGEIRIWNGVSIEATPFLDLSGEVTCCGEAGLLGLAFHPDFAVNDEFFVNYTRTELGQLQTVVSRFTVSPGDPDLADPLSEEILLTIDQPFGNHNAGDLAFGPDGYLYVPTGDGGSGGDPEENGQDLAELLGKVLRLDVDSAPDPGLDYAIPPDNPFVGQAGARGEIWAYGLRNPFRVSFDRRSSTSARSRSGTRSRCRSAWRTTTSDRRPPPRRTASCRTRRCSRSTSRPARPPARAGSAGSPASRPARAARWR